MANSSIYAAFERMWQHIVALVGTKAESNHDHDDMYYTEAEVDAKLAQVESDYKSADSALSSTLTNSINGVQGHLTSHTGNKSNPHGVTKAQVGLENVENKSSATILSEMTKENVISGLGYEPSTVIVRTWSNADLEV